MIIEVSEEASVGQYLGFLPVKSPGGVLFSLETNPQKGSSSGGIVMPLLINPASGVMMLDAPLDYEQEQTYNITVTATATVSVQLKYN